MNPKDGLHDFVDFMTTKLPDPKFDGADRIYYKSFSNRTTNMVLEIMRKPKEEGPIDRWIKKGSKIVRTPSPPPSMDSRNRLVFAFRMFIMSDSWERSHNPDFFRTELGHLIKAIESSRFYVWMSQNITDIESRRDAEIVIRSGVIVPSLVNLSLGVCRKKLSPESCLSILPIDLVESHIDVRWK